MSGNNYFDANNVKATVHDADGNEYELSRPNARDLVNTGNYFWAASDVGKPVKPEPESDEKSELVLNDDGNTSIYNKETGEEMVVTPANARELVDGGKFSFEKFGETETPEGITASESQVTESTPPAPENDEQNGPVEGVTSPEAANADENTAPENVQDESNSGTTPPPENVETTPDATGNQPASDPLDPMKSSLKDIAQRVTGNDDVEAYLNTFSADALRQMATERYGEALHHRIAKTTAITKLLAFEANRESTKIVE